MLAWNGSLGISKFDGITSPAYCVYKSLIGGEKYFGYLFRTKNAQQEFKKQSTGIIDSRLRLYTDKFFNIKTVIPSLEETQQGKLKGGFSTMSAATLFGYSPDNNCYNNCDRGCKTKD